ncbi:MAG: hypothetical protein AAGE52_09900 [Myxococcota bacterium]
MARISIALVTCMGCLVTDNAQQQAGENFPPSIVSGPEAADQGVALNQIIRVDLDTFEGSELQIPVTIRDPNFSQELEYEVFLDFNEASDSPVQFLVSEPNSVVPPVGTLARSLVVRVPVARLTTGCHQVELRVSSEFRNAPDFRFAVEPEDFAEAIWWVSVEDEDNRSVELSECP